MPPSPQLDPIQQRLEAIEQHLKALERSQHQATLAITRQLEAFIQLHSLIGPVPGLLHGWPVSADFALHMLQLLLAQPPELVIEFGSGTSTYLLLQGLALAFPQASGSAQGARSAPQLLTFEHLAEYHHRTAELIAPCRLRRHAQLLLAPLQAWSDASGEFTYYGQVERISATAAAALRRKRQRPLRRLLVIVDGPPGATGPQARYPALPVLLDAIPADPAHPLQVTLLLDDLHRPEEQAVAASWQALLAERGITATRRDHGFEKGALELRFAL